MGVHDVSGLAKEAKAASAAIIAASEPK